jgi:hypothetical protein
LKKVDVGDGIEEMRRDSVAAHSRSVTDENLLAAVFFEAR